MSVIISSAWKGKKEGTVTYKGVEYEIGIDAFGSIEDAVQGGYTSDLIIVDKKLTSPVKNPDTKEYEPITDAATDIFASTENTVISADGKTETKTISFNGAAAGTATIKDSDATLNGFDSVTANKAGGSFFGGRVTASENKKTVDDDDKEFESTDITASVNSSSSGSLSVTGVKDTPAEIAEVGTISDSVGGLDTVAGDIADIYEAVTGNELDKEINASYANVTLKYVDTDADFNGGVFTESASMSVSNTADEKINTRYTYSSTERVGGGTADLKDSNVGELIGFGNVKIANTALDEVVVGDIEGGNVTENYTLATTFADEVSSTYAATGSRSESVAGNLTVTGKKDHTVTIEEVESLSSMNLKFTTVDDGIENYSGTSQGNVSINVRKQGDNDALTATGTGSSNSFADGTLTASNSEINGGIYGVKNVSLTDSTFENASAQNQTSSFTKSETGFAVAGISADQKADYADNFYSSGYLDTNLVDVDEAYTMSFSSKSDDTVGGAKFSVAGKAAGAGSINYYRSVSLDNKDKENLSIKNLLNETHSFISSGRESFTPEKSYTKSYSTTETNSAVGDATIKGYTYVNVNGGFASVKVTGSKYDARLSSVVGQANTSDTRSTNATITATQEDPRATYSETHVSSSRLATTVDVSKAILGDSFSNLKSVKLQNVKAEDGIVINNGLDTDVNSSSSVTWNADDIASSEIYSKPTSISDERIISWNSSYTAKNTVAGDFSLKNTDTLEDAPIDGIELANFRNVDITLAAKDAATAELDAEFSQAGDSTVRSSEALALSETRRTYSYSYAQTGTAVGNLKITGKSAKEGATTISADGDINFANITLKDVQVVGGGSASAYSTSSSVTKSESATLDAGDVAAVTYTLSKNFTSTGIGKFSASVSKVPDEGALTVFGGVLNGYGTISLSNVNIGSVNNYKTVGGYSSAYVPWDGEYFGPTAEEIPEDAAYLSGNITGSYTMAANGQINAKWTATNSSTASGSFTQEGAKVAVTAGSITGYDKVTLTAAAAELIQGISGEETTVLTYTVNANGDETADTKVITEKQTSGSSVKLAGKKIGSEMVNAAADAIEGYQNVTLQNANVGGEVQAVNSQSVLTIDKLNEESTDDSFFAVQNTSFTAVGSLTATDSEIGGIISGFQTVKLTNTNATEVKGGSSAKTAEGMYEEDFEVVKWTAAQEMAVGSFTAEVTSKDLTEASVGVISGFQKVSVTDYTVLAALENTVDYSSETIFATANSLKVIPGNEDKEIPEIWQMAGSTKSNSFSATAKKNTAMAVAAVSGFGKVDATGLTAVGPVQNFSIQDDIQAFADRKYSAAHYGDWTATYQVEDEETGIYTAISSDASSASAKITGKAGTKANPEAVYTAVSDIRGYGSVTLNLVDISGAESFAGGKFAYTTKTNADDEFIATSKSEAAGKLTISNATGDAAFAVEGFKDVDIKLAGGATISSIVGGTEFAQFTDSDLDYTTYAVSGKLNLVTLEGTVEGLVAGFDKVSFTDTGIGADAEIQGYAVDAKFIDDEWVQTVSGKSTITFDNTVEGSTEIAGTITNAKAIEFKTSKADAETTDFVVTGTINSQKAEEEDPFVNTKVTVTKCEASMDFQNFMLDKGDVVELKSGAVIELSGLTEDTLESYFSNMIDAEISGKGTLTAAITDEQWETAIEGMKIAKGVTFVSSLEQE